jgi:hypothetical protein
MATHRAETLRGKKRIVYTAQSAKNFHQRMLICKFVFEKGAVPVNPFNLFGYFLYELIDRDLVRNGNNNVLERCDELWAFGDVSDGMLAEIKMFTETGKPVRYFDISRLPEKITATTLEKLPFEEKIRSRKRSAVRALKSSHLSVKRV